LGGYNLSKKYSPILPTRIQDGDQQIDLYLDSRVPQPVLQTLLNRYVDINICI